MSRVSISGAGVSAWAAAVAIAATGREVGLVDPQRFPRQPTVLLNPLTCRLLRDLFGDLSVLRRGSWPIQKRRVEWGRAPAALVEAPALAVPSDALIEGLELAARARLGPRLALRSGPVETGGCDWLISAEKTPSQHRRTWGRRVIVAAGVEFSTKSGIRSAHMRTGAGGWIFFFPTCETYGVVQLMSPTYPKSARLCLEEAVCDLRSSGVEIGALAKTVSVHEASPSLVRSSGIGEAIAVGSGAATFDPLCGDGTGFAVRSSLLAAAAIDRIELFGRGANGPLDHYQRRVSAAMLQHLRACDHFYSERAVLATWKAEIRRGQDGIQELRSTGPEEPYRYRLVGRSLVPVSTSDIERQAGEED